ncbi:potassium-transporting ATPase subunit KdpC [Cellulomonas chengniuliangii]|uniref:Potassium-transporting ATPase KdpC subunit n=1 Tax=Cellulomonas chengniuliangii TaxID=2968084 RepID=A0ABY5KVZ1_9CELL|nr:potassium-transporting ATPase subunit KdpC [Cellulomonas chengniuliangii]MCC2309969.1 potassium-transporting ATPase subunit KdpC [Cellulomonas chengniuliangii]UUI74630.1 potassium-transporting ATPase subunit KdpC [Cellulomonas chengniuliangii]
MTTPRTATPVAPHPRPHTTRSAGATLVALTRQTWAGLRVLLVLTAVLGFAYPLAVAGIAQVAFPWQANGSLVSADGAHVTTPNEAAGSVLLGQTFEGDEWFHPRPSAGGYDTLASGGSNLGPTNPDLLATVTERRAEVAVQDGVDPASAPPDALTASGSGLDPHISPEYASQQVARVAEARGVSATEVAALVEGATQGRGLGVLGEPRVNVLELNLALTTMGS